MCGPRVLKGTKKDDSEGDWAGTRMSHLASPPTATALHLSNQTVLKDFPGYCSHLKMRESSSRGEGEAQFHYWARLCAILIYSLWLGSFVPHLHFCSHASSHDLRQVSLEFSAEPIVACTEVWSWTGGKLSIRAPMTPFPYSILEGFWSTPLPILVVK